MATNSLRKQLSNFDYASKVGAISAASLFLPYFLCVLFGIFAVVYALINKDIRRGLLKIGGSRFLLILPIISLLTAFHFKNYWGMMGALAVAIVIIYGLFILLVMTEDLFDFIIKLFCRLSYISFLFAALQMLLIRTNSGLYKSLYLLINPEYFNGLLKAYQDYRSMSTFYNASYFAAIASFMVLVCVYKLLKDKNNRLFYIITAVVNIGSMMLADSRIAYLSLAAGITVLLICFKRYKILLGLMGIVALILVVFVINPSLIPRFDSLSMTTLKRFDIWKTAFSIFKTSPILGRGMWGYMDYASAHIGLRWAVHSHNVYLEMLICFGAVGCGLILTYFIKMIKNIHRSGVRPMGQQGALLLSLVALLLVSGVTDVVITGAETCFFILIIFSVMGLYIKKGDVKDVV